MDPKAAQLAIARQLLSNPSGAGDLAPLWHELARRFVLSGITISAAGAVNGITTSLIPNPLTQDLLFTDATYDIGKSGATRPRDGFFSRNMVVGGTLQVVGNHVADLLFTDATYDIGKAGATRPRDGFFSRNMAIGGTLDVTGASTFLANLLLSKTRPDFKLLHSGTTGAHVLQAVANTVQLTSNLTFDGANWNLDDTGSAGILVSINPAVGWFFQIATAGANPRSLSSVFTLDTSGNISAFGGQLAFPATQNPSAGANTLDDYEEGSWTPVIGGSGGTSGQTYTTQVGRYCKIGQFVFAQCYILLSNKGTITANVQIQGLPFTSDTTSNAFGSASVQWSGLSTNWVDVVGQINPNSTAASIVGATAAAAANNTALATADISNSGSFVATFLYRASA